MCFLSWPLSKVSIPELMGGVEGGGTDVDLPITPPAKSTRQCVMYAEAGCSVEEQTGPGYVRKG